MPTLFQGHYLTTAPHSWHIPGWVCYTHKVDGRAKALSFVGREDPCRRACNRLHAHDQRRAAFKTWAAKNPGVEPKEFNTYWETNFPLVAQMEREGITTELTPKN